MFSYIHNNMQPSLLSSFRIFSPHPKEIPYSLVVNPPFSSHQNLENTMLISDSLDLLILGISLKRKHKIYCFSGLAFFTYQMFPSSFLLKNVSVLHFSLSWIMFHCRYMSLFVYSSIDRHLSCSNIWAIMNNVAMNFVVYVFVWTYVFISLGNIPKIRIAGSCNCIFNILRNCQIVFQTSCIILWSYQQCMNVQFFHSLSNV